MAIYHVNYITGSNTNTGGATDPYATIQYAIDTNVTGAGDTVKVAGSGLTSRDAAATIVAGGSYNSFTTSVDLTTTIAVGDVVVINPPNVADYNNWATVYVTAITATTITFNEGLYLAGTARVGNWEIFTIDEIIGSTASTFETLTTGNGNDTVVEGGYNSGFTAIVGRTYFRRTGLGAGSKSGNCFVYGNGPNQSNVIFKNFGFLQWNNAFSLSFGSSYRADNLLFMYSNPGTSAFNAIFPADAATPADLYLIDCSTTTQGQLYYNQTIENQGFGHNFNFYIYNRANTVNLASHLTKLVIWNSYIANGGSAFGGSALIKNVLGCVLNDCDLTWNVIDDSDPDGYPVAFNRSTQIFSCEASQVNQILGNLNSVTKIDGGVTTYFYNWFNNIGNPSWLPSCIKTPTGYTLKDDTNICGTNADSNKFAVGSNTSLIDDDYTWQYGTGSYVASDTVTFNTGDSSKVLFGPDRLAYANSRRFAPAFSFIKAATNPVSVTFSARLIVGSGATIRVTGSKYNEQVTGTAGISNTTGWTDYTMAFNTLGTAVLDGFSQGSIVQLCLENTQTPPATILIDKITINY